MTTAKRHIHLVEDNDDFRKSAGWWLSGLGYEVKEFGDPELYLDFVRTHLRTESCLGAHHEPVCVLLDVRMPGLSGLQVHDKLNQWRARWPVIYMTGHGDVPLAVEAMRLGAVSFLEKPFEDDALEQALEAAFRSLERAHEPDDGSRPCLDELPPAPEAALPTSHSHQEFERRVAALTNREREVLQHVVDGLLNKTIADRLGISIKTVELHRSRVMAKMRAASLTQLIKMVMLQEAQAE